MGGARLVWLVIETRALPIVERLSPDCSYYKKAIAQKKAVAFLIAHKKRLQSTWSLILKNLRRLTSIACLSLLVSAPLLASNQEIETFTIIQDNPVIKHIDLGAPGGSHGDLLAFEASFADKDGNKGVMSGVIITVALPDGIGGQFYDRIGNVALDFGGIDSLVLAGKSLYPTGAGEMQVDAPQVRAVTGGTGRYLGARGQMTTTRRDAGHYEHVIELLK